MSGGQQATFGQGAVNVLGGDETEGTMTGSSSTASPGSFGKSVFARLRSRKIQESSSSKALTGSVFSGAQGAFGKQRTRSLSGAASGFSTGTITYVPGDVEPPPAGETIVDEVSTDQELDGHNDILWYANFEGTLSDLVPNDFQGAQYIEPNRGGVVDTALVPVPEFGINAFRAGSSNSPNNALGAPSGGWFNWVSSSIGDGQTWMNLRKWATPAAGVASVKLSTTPIRKLHVRWVFMIPRLFLTTMTEPNGTKLQGTIWSPGGVFTAGNAFTSTMWLTRHSAGQTRWRLKSYWLGGRLGDSSAVTLDMGEWIYPDVFNCFEQFIEMNSAPGVADGNFWVRYNNKLIRNEENVILSNFADTQLTNIWAQVFHGGPTPGPTPSARTYAYVAAYAASLTRRIGPPKLVQPMLTLDLNNSVWTSPGVNGTGWNQAGTNGSQRVNMEYSNAHQHTNGRQLEFSRALHSQPAGDNTGVRWAEFDELRPPTQGYYWSNADTLIQETDNMPTAYLPWKGWVALFGGGTTVGNPVPLGMKIISIDGTPSAIYRNLDGSTITDYVDVTYPTGAGLTAITPNNEHHNSNYNPACWVNPAGTITGWWGGGYGNSFPNSRGSIFKLLDDNPNYPTSSKQLRLRVFRPTGAASPTHTRHMVQIGDWLYWGGGFINPDTGSVGDAATKLADSRKFYRIYVPDLSNNVFTQEQITSAPATVLHPNMSNVETNVRYNLLCADQTRTRLIYMNINGVHLYTVPAGGGSNGTWQTFTFGMTANEWASAISEGNVDLGSGLANWHGLIGTHRSDLGQGGMTFFRYNLSKRWNRIEWPA
jgi:hypothetical protein